MGVIYSIMQGECTTLPDTIVFNSKMNRPNKPEAKQTKKSVVKLSRIGAISCETPSPSQLNITIPHFPLPFKGTLTLWRHITRKLCRICTKDEPVSIKHNTNQGVISVVSIRRPFGSESVQLSTAPLASLVQSNEPKKKSKGNRKDNQCLHFLSEWHKPSVSKISVYIVSTVHLWVSL